MISRPRSSPVQIRELVPRDGIIVTDSYHTKTIHTINYLWKIDNYSVHHEKKTTLKTPVFTADTKHDCRWYLMLEHDPEEEDDDDSAMGLGLYLETFSPCKKVFAKYKFSILDDKLKKYCSCTCDNPVIFEARTKSGWYYPKFIRKNFLLRKKLLRDDRLSIYCEIIFSELESFDEILIESKESNLKSSQLLPSSAERCVSKDLSNLFKTQKLTDVILSVKGKEYRAHKVVLAARSPVFAAMFEHNTKEKEYNLVEITDIEEKVVEDMLHYMYTDTCENLKDLAGGLLVASDKYDLEGLKIMCQEALVSGLNVENVLETLNLAHLCCAAELKSKTIDFIVANSVVVTNSAEWKNRAPSYPPSLLMEIVEGLSRQTSNR